MKNKIILGILAAVLVIAGIFFATRKTNAPTTGLGDVKNTTFTIEGDKITLINGHAEMLAAPGSASKIITTYFGNEAVGDLNGDSIPDIGLLLTQETGGSGTFYYVVVALGSANGYTGTNGVLLGDRIAPQTTEIRNGKLVVNYADRKTGESMTAQPTVGVSKYLHVQGTELVEDVAQ